MRAPTATSGSPSRHANQIGMINPATHAIAEFPIPTAASRPDGITAGPDGNLWFTEYNAGKIGEINPATHAVTEFPIPYTGSQPQSITAGPDGNLWFADSGTHAIGVVTLVHHQLGGDGSSRRPVSPLAAASA